eukprot:scaffold314148_cov31-Tisochrysis_lutea.AAC.1
MPSRTGLAACAARGSAPVSAGASSTARRLATCRTPSASVGSSRNSRRGGGAPTTIKFVQPRISHPALLGRLLLQ